jgi:hypothetical protein
LSYTDRKQKLDSLLDDGGIEFFPVDNLARLDNPNWDGADYSLPAEDKLSRIIPTLRLADEIRRVWGGPVQIVSGYRPPEYNALVGGSPESQHKAFRAVDLQPTGDFDLDRFFAIVRSVVAGARVAGQNVGLGLYHEGAGSFAHIDVGAPTGTNRSWVRPRSKPNDARVGV